jgi:uncharacterized DUF497 family protein
MGQVEGNVAIVAGVCRESARHARRLWHVGAVRCDTARGDNIRIISARRAERHEQDRYYRQNAS